MIRVIAIALAIVTCSVEAHARVVRIEISHVELVAPPPGAERIGPFEHVVGRIHGEVDPADPKNALITDLALAPRDPRGMVAYVATFSLMKPVDMTKWTGVLKYTVPNRGGGLAVPSADGHVTLVSGWQADVASTGINQTMWVPVARDGDGRSLTGSIVLRLLTARRQTTLPVVVPRNQPAPYPPVTLETSRASLVAITGETAAGVRTASKPIPGDEWAFADCRSAPFPGKPDPSRVCAKDGFTPSTIYELTYVAQDPLVLGLGLAATRDINSFFRYDTADTAGMPNPLAGRIRWTVSDGSSQSGAFLRLMLRLGFNQDEAGRKVWDGVNVHISARTIDLNRRFAMPGGNVLLHDLGYEAPSWWERWDDKPRGRGAAGVLDRCRQSNTCPKIMETFGASELWGFRHSFSLVGTDAKADIPLPENVRRYYFPGVGHGGGAGGFNHKTSRATAASCDLPANPAPIAPMYRALQRAFIDWVTKDAAMPASRYPRIADRALVRPTAAAMGFPKIPGVPAPDGLIHPLLDYDVGDDFNYRDQSGVALYVPRVKGVLPQLVVRVDADGNEVAGVKSPLLMAPLGTYVAWNIASSGVFRGGLCQNNGNIVAGYIPFAATKAERVANGDPRPSLEERYQTHAGYVTAVTTAANVLVKDGFLLPADAAAIVRQAEQSGVLVAGR
jgi:hypothetical protein